MKLIKKIKTFFLLILISLPIICPAQFKSATIGVDGLTCSMCSFGTEKSLRKLDFVESVKMDLNKATAEITFKKNSNVSIEALAKKVKDAGFSVRFIKAVFQFNEVTLVQNSCYEFENASYCFLKPGEKPLNGDLEISFIGEKFQTKKDFSQYKELLSQSAKKTADNRHPVYYVIL